MQKEIVILDFVSGLSETFSGLLVFDSCSYWHFMVRECVTRVPAALVLLETQVVDHLFHSSFNPELRTLHCFQDCLALKWHL